MAQASKQDAAAEPTGGTSLEPREMTRADLPGVVALHKACFEGYFLTELGDGAIARFYREAVDDPASVATVLEDPGSSRIVGLAVGTLDAGFHTRLLRRALPVFAWGVVRGLAVSATIRSGIAGRLVFFRRLFRAEADRSLAEAGIPESDGTEARFLDVAVHPDVRGGRNAERLVEYFAERVFARGAARVGGTVRPENLGSLILYKRLGWNVKRTAADRFDVWTDRPAS